LERPTRLEALDDLPGAEVLFVGVGADEVEIQLVGEGFGEEVAAAREGFQVEELIFDEAVNGFDIALEGVSGGKECGYADCRLKRRGNRWGDRGDRDRQ
jgi:hypothetical protein